MKFTPFYSVMTFFFAFRYAKLANFHNNNIKKIFKRKNTDQQHKRSIYSKVLSICTNYTKTLFLIQILKGLPLQFYPLILSVYLYCAWQALIRFITYVNTAHCSKFYMTYKVFFEVT